MGLFFIEMGKHDLYRLNIGLVQIARDITTFRPTGPKCGEWLQIKQEYNLEARRY